MSDKNMKEILADWAEKQQKFVRAAISDRLGENERFSNMRDAFKKAKRYKVELSALLDEDKYAAKKSAIEDKLTELEEKRAVAQAALSDIEDYETRFNTAVTNLQTQLTEVLNGTDMSNVEDVDAKIDALLESADLEGLDEAPADPLAAYRRAKSE